MADIAERCGAKVVKVEAEWGKPMQVEEVKKTIQNRKPRLLAFVHAETSTGVLQPFEEISKLTKQAGALFVVDAVTSYCGTELEVDEWGIDALYSRSQKCLSAAPGLSPVTLSQAAIDVLDNRRTKVQSQFLDLSMVKNYWACAKRAYHHTAPVSAMYALREALRIVLEQGLQNRFERHRKNHALLCDGLEAMGFQFLLEKLYGLPMLNAVVISDGVDEAGVRKRLLEEYNREIGGGLGPYAGKIWRIWLMGESSDANHVNMLMSTLKKVM